MRQKWGFPRVCLCLCLCLPSSYYSADSSVDLADLSRSEDDVWCDGEIDENEKVQDFHVVLQRTDEDTNHLALDLRPDRTGGTDLNNYRNMLRASSHRTTKIAGSFLSTLSFAIGERCLPFNHRPKCLYQVPRGTSPRGSYKACSRRGIKSGVRQGLSPRVIFSSRCLLPMVIDSRSLSSKISPR